MSSADPAPDTEGLLRRLGDPVVHPAVAAVFGVLDPGAPLVVACSGGADSVAALALCHARFGAGRLVVAHYNHRWRGDASDGDRDFVAALADRLGCRFVCGEASGGGGPGSETAAREPRIRYLRGQAAEAGAPVIVFGHQRDDVIESMLLRLVRGAGIEGLCAPRPVHRFASGPDHLRPLLHHPARALREALAGAGIGWCEDRSNEDLAIPRNAVRHRVVPLLAGLEGRDPLAAAARTRALLEEDAEALDELARTRLPEAFEGVPLPRTVYRGLPRALQRRALRNWLAAVGLAGCFDAGGLDRLLDGLAGPEADGRWSAGAGFIVADRATIAVEAPGDGGPIAERELAAGASLQLPGGAQLACERVELTAELRGRIRGGAVDPRDRAYLKPLPPEEDRLIVRGWQPGDRFKPLGAPGNRKLSDWFIDRRIARGERERLPVVLSRNGEILWVPGFAPADVRRLGPRAKTALKLTYHA